MFIFAAFLIVAAAIDGAHGAAMISGTVFCDQCKDGRISLFDYPVYGIKVSMVCPGSNGQLTTLGEETTNWIGNYNMRIEGTPDFSGCYAQVKGNGQSSTACGAVAGPARYMKLMFRMFDMEIYTVDPLLSQPSQPMHYCPRSASPVPAPVTPTVPPPVKLPPVPAPVTPRMPPPVKLPPVPHLPPLPPRVKLPVPRLPPLPPLPSLPPMPSLPFFEASACPHQKWKMPEYKCYWRVVRPDTKVAVIFGVLAAGRYGTDITLWQSMEGRGEPYRTLLREGTTAFLNSYNSIHFPYHPLGVIEHLNWALMGSTKQVLHTALQFMRANSGNGNTTCRFTPCK